VSRKGAQSSVPFSVGVDTTEDLSLQHFEKRSKFPIEVNRDHFKDRNDKDKGQEQSKVVNLYKEKNEKIPLSHCHTRKEHALKHLLYISTRV
jgi:hypothetical protein